MPGLGRQWWSYSSRERYDKQATNDAWWLTHRSVAKQNSVDSPYLIANEWIAAQLGAFLRLPIPPAALTRRGAGHKGLIALLEYEQGDSAPNDVKPAECIRAHANVCIGIFLFDVLIANADRHTKNLLVDTPRSPNRIILIDHDRCMFGTWAGEGCDRLNSLRDRLGVSGGSATGENRHCFLSHIHTFDHFAEWMDRIRSIPTWFFEEICDDVLGLPLTRDEVSAAIDFLTSRRDNIHKIVWNNRDELSIRQATLVNPFDYDVDD